MYLLQNTNILTIQYQKQNLIGAAVADDGVAQRARCAGVGVELDGVPEAGELLFGP